jgi:hypothetical protein
MNKSIFISFLISLFATGHILAQNLSGPVDNVRYPFKDFGRSTVAGIFFGGSTEGFEKVITENPRRQSTLTLEGRAHLTSFYKVGLPDNPLVILVPGIGGFSSSASLMDLAQTFSRFNFSVMTVNNPFSWPFALTLLPEATPGYFPRDSQVFYQYLQSTLRTIQKRSGMKYSEVWVFSYSLGGQYAQELLKIDDNEKMAGHQAFSFKKVIMLNPPLDISYTLPKYDEYNRMGARSSQDGVTYYEMLRGLGIGLLSEMAEKSPSQQLAYFTSRFPYDNDQSQVMIGGSFKESLEEVLYVTSLVNSKRKKIFRSSLHPKARSERYAEIKKISFSDYFEKFIWPEAPQTFAAGMPKDFIASLSIKSNLQNLVADERVRFILTEDDPISRPEDVALFGKAFGDRALVFKYGGHVGLPWFPGFAYDLKSFLQIK